MKRSLILALGIFVALNLATPLIAAAVPGPQSDNNMRWARGRVERDIDMLQRDNHDYGGHRVKAIAFFRDARSQILLGLGYDARHDNNQLLNSQSAMAIRNNECGSDINLNNVRRDIEHVIDVLQRDNGDYGGHRVLAIERLQQGREELAAAIQYDATH